jgi:ParB family chromosome partitioning protein
MPLTIPSSLDLLPHLGRAGEGDLVDALVLDERGAGAPVAGDDVHDAGGQLGLAEDVTEQERAERRRLGRLEHDRVAARERGRDLPREHEEREVPRDDLAGDADRAWAPVGERVLELVGPAGVVEEMRRGERQVDVAGLLDRLAAVERLEDGELPGTLLEDARDAEEVLRALGAGKRRPAVGVCLARRGDCGVDVGRRGLADAREHLLVARRDRLVTLRRLEPLAADVVAVPVSDVDDVAGLGRARVRPVAGDADFAGLLVELSHDSPGHVRWGQVGRGVGAFPKPTPHPHGRGRS